MNEQEQQLWEKIDGQDERIMRHFKEVIGVNTIAPPANTYSQLLDIIEPHFQALGFKTERVEIPFDLVKQYIPLPIEGPRVNLVASKSTGKEPVTIYAHMDTVPVEEKWTEDPFGAELKDGKIYGRGTADMKGSIASLLSALEVANELGIELNYDPIICLCTDEEIGGYPGIWHLAKNGYVNGHMVCMEGGQDPRIGLASAGSVDVTVTTVGRSCHSGSNYKGVNAVDAMIPILNELYALKQIVEKRESSVPGGRDPEAPSKQMTPMFNLDIINAGIKSNIVPATCSLTINRRFIPEETFESVTSEIREAVERGADKSNALDVKIDEFRTYPSMKKDPNGPHTLKMKEAYKLVHGYKDEDFIESGGSGSTDMANVQLEMGWDDIPNCGPGRRESRAHGADEFVYLNDVKAHMKCMLHYLAF